MREDQQINPLAFVSLVERERQREAERGGGVRGDVTSTPTTYRPPPWSNGKGSRIMRRRIIRFTLSRLCSLEREEGREREGGREKREKERDRQKDRQTDRQTETETDRQTDRDKQRQTDRQTERTNEQIQPCWKNLLFLS